MYKEVEGDLFQLADAGLFDVVAHQTNCFCLQGAGISGKFALRYGTDNAERFKSEDLVSRGDFNKLGTIESFFCNSGGYFGRKPDFVANMYGQFKPGSNTDYTALRLCLRKLNHRFKGNRIGLPQIGCGIGGGSWEEVAKIIQEELIDCDTTVVIYKKEIDAV